MSKPKKAAPIGELQAHLRDMAAHPAQHQAASIERQIPTDTEHPSGIEALKFVALVHAAKTDLDAERHLNVATAHWKDFMLWDDSILGEKHRSDQSNRRKGKGTLTADKKKRIQEMYKKCVEDGEKYGAIRTLAKCYGVSESTIKTILKAEK